MGRVRGDHDCGFLRRMWRRGLGIACVAAAVMSLTSCVPQGKAVGDTQESEPEIAHEGVQRQDIVVGVIGSVDTGLDSDVLNAFNKAGLKAPYVSTSMVDDPDAAAQRGVRSMVMRKATVIMIDGIAVNEKTPKTGMPRCSPRARRAFPSSSWIRSPARRRYVVRRHVHAYRQGRRRDRPRRRRRHHRRGDKPHPRTMNVTDNLS